MGAVQAGATTRRKRLLFEDLDPKSIPDLPALRQALQERGAFTPRTGRVLTELGLHLALGVGGALLFLSDVHWSLRILGILISTVGSMGVGTNAHTASHYGTSRSRRLDEGLTYFGYAFWQGLSATYWWHQHVVVHHPQPNVVGKDDDVDFMPFLALREEDLRKVPTWTHVYYRRLQAWLLPVMLAANGFNMQRAGWFLLCRRMLNPSTRRARHMLDALCLLLHFAAWLALPIIVFGPLLGVSFYVLRIALQGYAMFAILGPGHLPPEATFIRPDDPAVHHKALLQTACTTNFRAGLGAWFTSGLQYQVEHHLFPGLPHPSLPAVSRLVRRWCATHGLPYNELGWVEALWKIFQVFRRFKPIGRLPMPGVPTAG